MNNDGLQSVKDSNSICDSQSENRKLESSEINSSSTDEIIERIRAIFSYYASFGDRMNTKFLKSNKFHKMMIDANVERSLENKKSLDIIFCSHNSHKPNMNFETFLDILPDIAKFAYPTLSDETEAISSIIKQNLLPLYQKYINSELGTADSEDLSSLIDQETINIIQNLESILFEIYNTYFPWEVKSAENLTLLSDKSSKEILKFLAQYDICPSIISKPMAFQLYQSTVSTYSQFAALISAKYRVGVSLTFPRFVDYLIKISCQAYKGACKEDGKPYPLSERLLIMLERMELSAGFTNIEKLTNKPHTSKISLINVNKSDAKPVHKLSNIEDARSQMSNRFLTNEEIPSETYDLLNQSASQLTSIFKRYCLFGEPLNHSLLKSAKFIKLLTDCGVIESETHHISTISQISKTNADLIFAKIIGASMKEQSKYNLNTLSDKSSNLFKTNGTVDSKSALTHRKAMDFHQFQTALIHIANKSNPSINILESVKIIIDRVLQLDKGEHKDQNDPNGMALIAIIQNEEAAQFLSVVYQSWLPYYLCYAGPKKLMNFDALVKLFTDFDIYPSMLSKPKLMSIFETLCKIFQSSSGDTPEECIDEHLFIEAIALCSLEVQYKDPQPDIIDKIIYTLNKMSQSKGVQLAHLKPGNALSKGAKNDTLELIKIKYPERFGGAIPILKGVKMHDMLAKGLLK